MADSDNVKQYGGELADSVKHAKACLGLDVTEISTALVAIAASVVASGGNTQAEFLSLCERCFAQAVENRKKSLN